MYGLGSVGFPHVCGGMASGVVQKYPFPYETLIRLWIPLFSKHSIWTYYSKSRLEVCRTFSPSPPFRTHPCKPKCIFETSKNNNLRYVSYRNRHFWTTSEAITPQTRGKHNFPIIFCGKTINHMDGFRSCYSSTCLLENVLLTFRRYVPSGAETNAIHVCRVNTRGGTNDQRSWTLSLPSHS